MSDFDKSKESKLLKMLLPASEYQAHCDSPAAPLSPLPAFLNHSSIILNQPLDAPSPTSDFEDHNLACYFQNISGTNEDELDIIQLDHCYARAWNWKPETSFMRPTKTLFMGRQPPHESQLLVPITDDEEDGDIDITEESPTPQPIYDVEKAKKLMDECETYVEYAVQGSTNEDWENDVNKTLMTQAQRKLFEKMVKILNMDRLGRLTYNGQWNEPIFRRAVIDKSVKRTRHLLASIFWDTKLIQWMHTTLTDHLSPTYLISYLDILQTLKSKVPTLVDKMMFSPNSSARIGPTSNESLFPLLKRPWDPVTGTIALHKPKKLPADSVIVVVPPAPNFRLNTSRRFHNWVNMLTGLASVAPVNMTVGNRMSMPACVDQMAAQVRARIQEVRQEYPDYSIVLVGLNTGAALACQVAELESVLCVVCLGFPLLTAEGKRGEPDDMLLELRVPALFVIGQSAHTASQEEMEDLRERMRVETGLVVVGSADDHLRVTIKKRKMEGITQSMVDRCVVDEIGDFIGSILLSPNPPQRRQSPVYIPPPPVAVNSENGGKRTKQERKRQLSTGSETVDSEPPSPSPQQKKARPVGRPPKDKSLKSKTKTSLATAFQQEAVNCWTDSSTTANSASSLSQTPSITGPTYASLNTSLPIPHCTGNSISHSSQLQTVMSVPSQSQRKPAQTPIDALKNSNTIDAVNQAVQSIQFQTTKPTQPTTSPVFIQTKNSSSFRPLSSQHSTLSTLLQGGTSSSDMPSRYQSTSHSSGIKVLENVTIPSSTKIFASSGRSIDLSKFTIVNPNASVKNLSQDKMVLLSDGSKIAKSSGEMNFITSVKSISSVAPTLVRGNSKPVVINTVDVKSPQVKLVSKGPLITKGTVMRKQIFTTRPRHKNSPIITKTTPNPTEGTPLSPASLNDTNILDIPIIFADNDSPLISGENIASVQNIGDTAPVEKPPTGKVVLINKQPVVSYGSSTLLQTPTMQSYKRPATTIGTKINQTTPMKYTKILVSKRPQNKGQLFENIDVEQQIHANTVPRPIHTTVVNAQAIKNKPEIKSFTTIGKFTSMLKTDTTNKYVVSSPKSNYTTVVKSKTTVPTVYTQSGARMVSKIISRPRVLSPSTGNTKPVQIIAGQQMTFNEDVEENMDSK